ncbi:MAG: phosphotransferase family protein [Chloroflexota bacterium]
MTTEGPHFASPEEFAARRGDAVFWRPWLAEVLDRHDLGHRHQQPEAGTGATHPTFVCGDVVVKLFGYSPSWRQAHAAERAAHRALATDPHIAAARLIAVGDLFDDPEAPWPYLITERVQGIAWGEAALSDRERARLAAELGGQIRRTHILSTAGIATHDDWSALETVAANGRSSLPDRLALQINDYLARQRAGDSVFVHGDLMCRHVFVEAGRITGIIDWGDAIAADRHYELAKLHLDLFDCDKHLLRDFLEASDWPASGGFADTAMRQAIERQAHMLAQHGRGDVFHKLPDLIPLHKIESLEGLAMELFAI